MRRTFRKKYISKYEQEAIQVTKKIIKIDYLNQFCSEKYKSVFYVPSEINPDKPVMCVLWGYTSIGLGDEIEMKGRLLNNIFLVWNLIIKKRCEQGELVNE